MAPKPDEGQVSLTQMLKALDKDTAAGLEKRLKKLSKKKAIKKPLDKNKADQIERQAGYKDVTEEISKWDHIIDDLRRAKHIKFPLDRKPDPLPSVSENLSALKPQNEFEEQIKETIQNNSDTILHDNKEMSKAEEKYLKAISLEEAQERHRELQRMRVLLSSYAAKMRRQKAIKSKSYRRLLKHERLRKHMKGIESNKDLLMNEIDKLQRLRARERASLKHKNTGKWAKHAKFRSKYDEEARKQMLEQIGIAEKLLQKPAELSESESDSDEDDVISNVSESSSGDEQSTRPNIKSDPIKPISAPSSTQSNARLVVSEEQINDKFSKKRSLIGVEGDVEMSQEMDADEEEDNDEEDDDEEQRMLMSEAFADDDVVDEFKRVKQQITGEEQPKDVDTFLPGWGDWAGPGIKVNKRKRRSFIIKAKRLPRRDDNLGNVIISEQADDKAKELMVKKLPRGIKSKEQLKKILTKPTAGTFVNQLKHREAIRPRIETILGARIEPMNKSALKSNAKARWQ